MHPDKEVVAFKPWTDLPVLKPHTMNDIRTHAIGRWPFECCGVIIDGEFVAKPNISKTPMNSFEIDPKEWSDDIQAIIHSHPEQDEALPSALDIKYQQTCNRPFGIIPTRAGWAGEMRWLGDHTLNFPLVGRPFIHGIYDCYSLIRAYYWQNLGIYMRDYPRDPDWWIKPDVENLYLKDFQKEGFEVVTDELREHDALLIKLIPRTIGPHHAAIITANSLILHHYGSELSRHAPLGPWLRHSTHRVRYVR